MVAGTPGPVRYTWLLLPDCASSPRTAAPVAKTLVSRQAGRVLGMGLAPATMLGGEEGAGGSTAKAAATDEVRFHILGALVTGCVRDRKDQ